jgi:2-oxoisovalerate dehydrogenase E1 component beta subunit
MPRSQTHVPNHELGEVPDGHYVVPLGTSAIRREGAALTILAYGTMVHVAMTAAAECTVERRLKDDTIRAIRIGWLVRIPASEVGRVLG